jgi:hypothetical protein
VGDIIQESRAALSRYTRATSSESARKARLETLLAATPPVLRFSCHILGNGARVFEEGSKLGVEGIVSKQIDKPKRVDEIENLDRTLGSIVCRPGPAETAEPPNAEAHP